MNEIQVRNRQRVCPIRTQALVHTARHLLEQELRLPAYALGLHLLSLQRMIELNQRWLNHDGPTDVITFDHRKEDPALELYGEIFLCPQQAIFQARQFRVAWPVELTRHLVHGVLHLRGFDDLKAQARVRLKRRENRLVHNLCQVIDLNRISGESCPLS